MVLFLLLILVAIVLGLIGAVAEGMGYLLIIAIVLFVGTLAVAATRLSSRMRRPRR
ncbi:hypothetical protein FBY35_4025 [Streptomyces sp. SLBN-118]|uniref:hypothetical protein n=1 Tax=Streptomyces sp. SLBN-118 TaxID=2768454 RepID=UPI00117403B6|nr:hypothetical protein [Streptomyces sp. SLBN-118]TQK42597.1 hypothetical protein FBY35_4025 [Streptomyces sp. SLBN-118]